MQQLIKTPKVDVDSKYPGSTDVLRVATLNSDDGKQSRQEDILGDLTTHSIH